MSTIPFEQRFGINVPEQVLDHARKVALSLLRSFADQPTYVLGITSALRGEGKTMLTLALSEVMAADFGLNVVVLDTHAEHPWAAAASAASVEPQGLSDWLSGACTLDQAVVGAHARRAMLPFGSQTKTSRDLLQDLVKVDALPQLRQNYSLILLDLPELRNPAGAALANLCDGVVLSVRAGETPEEAVRELMPMLENVTIHGVVLNRHRSAIPARIRQLFA